MENSSGSPKILVVDDNPMSLEMADAYLGPEGYEVMLAPSGEEALRMFEAGPPDLVILDIMMPGIDGFETCRRMRQLPEGERTPIVFLTALDDLSANDRALESGADDFLNKPIDRTELLVRARSLIRIKRLMVAQEEKQATIQRQNDQLRELQMQKEELTSMIVHDMKSPLNAIIGFAELALGAEGDHEEALFAIRRMKSSGEKMLRMVLDLMDVSRGEDGALKAELTDVDLGQLVDGVLSDLASRAVEREVASRVEDGLPVVRTDEYLIRRVVGNLVDNCIKYTGRGERIEVEVRTVPGSRVQIVVRDEGPGIPPAFRERIFEKYARLERDASKHGRVSQGLGLVFCRLAVEAAGGRLWVEDNQPRGSAFHVELPIRTA